MKKGQRIFMMGSGLFLTIFGSMTICWATAKYPYDLPILELLVTLGGCFMISISIIDK